MTDLSRLADYQLHTLGTHVQNELIVLDNDIHDFMGRLDVYDTLVRQHNGTKFQMGTWRHNCSVIRDHLLVLKESRAARRDLAARIENELYKRGERHTAGMYSK